MWGMGVHVTKGQPAYSSTKHGHEMSTGGMVHLVYVPQDVSVSWEGKVEILFDRQSAS